ncbi:hypothetical protein BaRGS_00020981 [Batillaria attramentaria]|uniref:Uncharacterized protein n=1 Tax=Batillaria attramentaria TaxID=370345 RepID=A0ABD0KKJ4_9CAEN
MTCKTDEQTQILDAVFFSRDDNVTCDANCQATESAEDSYQCFKSVSDGCKQRLSLSDLNTVYTSCDANATATKCSLQPIWQNHRLSTKDAFVVEYICVPQTTCHSYCVVSPFDGYGQIQMTYNFLLGDTNASDDNVVLHKYIFRDHTKDHTPWIKLENSYYYEGTTTLDLNVSTECGIRPPPLTIQNPQMSTSDIPTPTSETANSAGPSKSLQGQVRTGSPIDTVENDTMQLAVIISSAVAVAVVVALCIVAFVVLKRRWHRPLGKPKRHNDPVPTAFTGTAVAPPDDSDNNTDYMPVAAFTERGAHPCEPEAQIAMTSRPGHDAEEEEYGRLQYDRRVTRNVDGSETYDHVAVGGGDDVYNTLQREPKKQEVVDNVYNCTA